MDNKEIWEKNWAQLGDYAAKSAGNRWAFDLIRKVCRGIELEKDAVIIDAGCGIGSKSAVLAGLFPDNRVIGFDFTEQGIAAAKRYYRNVENLRFECRDVKDLDGVHDYGIGLVSAFELIEHLEDWESFAAHLCAISRKYVLLSTPSGRMREYEKDLGHYRNFRKGEIEAFMEAHGYEAVRVLYAGFPFWSPITRDVYDFVNTTERHKASDRGMEVTFNPVVHGITYFFYRYLTFDRIGDQFMGLFRKKE